MRDGGLAGVRRTLWPSMVAAQAALGAYAMADVAIALSAAPSVPAGSVVTALLWALGFALPIGALAGTAIAAVLAGWLGAREGLAAAVRRWRDAPGRAAAVFAGAFAIAVAIAGSAGFSIFAVRAFHQPALIAIACAGATCASAGFGVILYGVARRAIPRRLGGLAAELTLLVAIVAPAAAAIVLSLSSRGSRALWLRGAGLALGAIAVALVLWRLAAARLEELGRGGRAIVLAATVIAPVLALGPTGNDVALRDRIWTHATFVPAAAAAIAPLVDRDGDGFTAVLGGGDCAEGDGARSPRGVELAGNGVDEDCRFGDLEPAPPRAVATAAPPVDTVVLVTVAGLDVAPDGTLAPALPATGAKLAAGALRFRAPVGIAGPFRHVGPAFTRGRLPWRLERDGSGLPHGGPSLAMLVEAGGGRAFASLHKPGRFKDTADAFVADRTAAKAKVPGAIVDAGLGLLRSRAGRSLLWIHLDSASKDKKQVDAAIAHLLDEVGKLPSYRVILVGLANDGAARPPRGAARSRGAPGGPIAIFGTGIAPGESTVPVGLLDVYPTVLESLALSEAPSDWPELEPPAGTSLLAPGAPAAITGWIDDELVLGAVGPDGAVIQLDAARRFELFPHQGAASSIDEGARGGPLAPLVARLRDGLLAPRLLARNRLVSRARTSPLPVALEGSPATLAHTLKILGCTVEKRPGRQVALTIWLQGGERLDPDQFFVYKLFSPKRPSLRGWIWPVYGGYPFGEWEAGELVAMPLLYDERLLSSGTAIFWLGVSDGKSVLDVNEGAGNTPGWARVCPFEVAP